MSSIFIFKSLRNILLALEITFSEFILRKKNKNIREDLAIKMLI